MQMYVDGFSECLFEAGNVKPSQSAPANESGTSGGRGLIRGEQLVRAINASPVAYVWCFDLKGTNRTVSANALVFYSFKWTVIIRVHGHRLPFSNSILELGVAK